MTSWSRLSNIGGTRYVHLFRANSGNRFAWVKGMEFHTTNVFHFWFPFLRRDEFSRANKLWSASMKDGGYRWASTRFPLRDAAGNLICYAVVLGPLVQSGGTLLATVQFVLHMQAVALSGAATWNGSGCTRVNLPSCSRTRTAA
jgi:hypothetical protein